ncbi:MAG: phosphohydrolase [Candidatus Altiarchaeales archaeon HGW-Altiarchaeales-1]|nr:MAG: phosphohydrolase [Candidatus Altiarchaeales archaeon HGW-Altiarchaeales-1]
MENIKPKYKHELNEELKGKIHLYDTNRERDYLSEFASKSEDGLRREQKVKEDIRLKYSRDADRIIHTHAYSRYIDKTQVFFLVDNDHLTHRVLHVQLVSRIARTIGRALKLNEDLIEAISLGHDLGHAPFGHMGEEALSKLTEKKGIGRFLHNVQSVQFLDEIENQDLTLQVLDGILCHNGEEHKQKLEPVKGKDWTKFDAEIEAIKKGKKDYMPMTLEGCVVRFADVIAYLGRDLLDAREVGLIKDDSDIPEQCKEKIGVENSEMINNLIINLIENSYGQNYISYSKEMSEALEKYLTFNYEQIYVGQYKHEERLGDEERIGNMYEKLFETFLGDLEDKNKKSTIYKQLFNLKWIGEDYLNKSTHPAEKVRDFIAGMTDKYFLTTFKDISIPKKITQKFK